MTCRIIHKTLGRSVAQAALLAFAVLLSAPAPCRAQSRFVEGDYSFDILRLESLRRITTWEQEGVRVFVATGGAVIRQGPVRLAAPRMVVWFDKAASEHQDVRAAVVNVYAEGLHSAGGLAGPLADETREEVHGADAIFTRFTSTLSFVWDCPLTKSDEPVPSPLFARAEALTRNLQDEKVWETAAPDLPEERIKTVMDLFKATQIEGFVEEELITVVFIGDVHGAYGDLEVRADATVAWLDQERNVYEIYAQGDVRISKKADEAAPSVEPTVKIPQVTRTLEFMSADQLYINPGRARGLATRPELRMRDPRAPVETVYVFKGNEAYLIDTNTLSVKEVSISACEFAHPHYQFKADRAEILLEPPSTLLMAQDVRLHVGKAERTLLWMPFVGMDLTRRNYLLADYAVGSSSKFGTFIQTTWSPLDLTTPPPWVEEWLVYLDYYGERGPAIGTELPYRFKQKGYGRHEGRLRTYHVEDHGKEDDTGQPVPRTSRGRVHLEHRSQLSRDWRVDAEYYRLSDAGFLNEYFEADYEEEKFPESYVLARYLRDSTYLALLYKERVNRFLTQVEQTPSLDLEIIGLPLGRLVYDGSIVTGLYDLELKKRPRPRPDPPSLTRLHTDQMLSLPFSVGIFRLDPFVRALATWVTDSARPPGGSFQGSENRFGLGAGLTASTSFSRSFDLASEFFDINRLRHVIIPHAGIETVSVSGADSVEFIQMDQLDAIDSGTELTFGVRQRLQTKRLRQDEWTSINWAELDVALVSRSSDSVMRTLDQDFVRADLEMRLTDHVSLHSRDNRIGLEGQPDAVNLGVSLDYLPRCEFVLDYDRLTDRNSTITVDVVYKLSDRYKLLVLERYEMDSRGTGDNKNLKTNVILRRMLHEWVLDLGVHMEEANEERAIIFGFGPAGWGVFDDRRRARR